MAPVEQQARLHLKLPATGRLNAVMGLAALLVRVGSTKPAETSDALVGHMAALC